MHQDGLDPFPGGCKGCAVITHSLSIDLSVHPSAWPQTYSHSKYPAQALKGSGQGMQTSPRAAHRETPPRWDPGKRGSAERRQRKRWQPTN